MIRAPFDKLGHGVFPDQPDQILPAGAWTDSRNVRYRDGAAEKCRGYEAALGSLSSTETAIYAAPITDGTNYFWMYGSKTVLYATDGLTHANVTGALAPAATDDLGFNGGNFHGFMLLNDGIGIPQSWSPSLANDFASLTAWPAITCKVLRPFQDFIFALRVTTSGNYNPREIRWSDKAQQNALPLSWDYLDPTNQAGITELGQTGDLVIDALPLRNSLVIYKEQHTWLGEFVGGPDVFGFRQVFSHIGALTEDCVVAIGAQHLVLTDNDVVIHNGNDAQSVLDKRARKWLFHRINTNRFKRSYVVADHRNREAYICFPESGFDWPNLAIVWNWAENTLHPYELGGPKTWAIPGIIPNVSSITFDSESGSFDSVAGVFDEENYNAFANRVVFIDSLQKRAYQNDTGETYNGTAMQVYAERTGIGITEDLGQIKRIWRIWPRLSGTTLGDVLKFHIGVRDVPGGSTTWNGPYNFTIGTDYKLDVRLSGRIIDLRVEYSGTNTFRFFGFSVDYERSGER